MTVFAGLILAGGEGKRWGGPKAWATLPDGKSFLESCRGVLMAAGAHPIVATLPPGTNDPRLDGLATLALPSGGLDMFDSLVFGLSCLVEYSDWRVVTILPVDHPLVSPHTVITLSRTTARAAIPSFNGKHGHPVCLARSVAEAIVIGELTGPTLRDVVNAIGPENVPVADPGVVTNCNTPESLAAALKRCPSNSIEP